MINYICGNGVQVAGQNSNFFFSLVSLFSKAKPSYFCFHSDLRSVIMRLIPLISHALSSETVWTAAQPSKY